MDKSVSYAYLCNFWIVVHKQFKMTMIKYWQNWNSCKFLNAWSNCEFGDLVSTTTEMTSTTTDMTLTTTEMTSTTTEMTSTTEKPQGSYSNYVLQTL